MTYRDETLRLADESERDLLATFQALSLADFMEAGPTLVALYIARAVNLADLALAVQLDRLPLGLAPPDEGPRLVKSFATLVDRFSDDKLAIRRTKVSRLARSEPLHAGRLAFAEAMTIRSVVGWTRKTGPDPCDLCRSLADGSVLPPGTKMADHPGCACTAVPVTHTERI